VETPHPALQAAVVGIDVLNVEGVVDDTDAGAEIDGRVGDVCLLGKGCGSSETTGPD
jgi:hypothetical protein